MSNYKHLQQFSCLSSLSPTPREYRLSPRLQPTGVDARPGVFSLTPKKENLFLDNVLCNFVFSFLSGADILFSLFRNRTAFILIIKRVKRRKKEEEKVENSIRLPTVKAYIFLFRSSFSFFFFCSQKIISQIMLHFVA